MMINSVTISTMHIPPSVNACYSNVRGKGRVKTKRYRIWANAAGWDFNGDGSIEGPFSCVITIGYKKRHLSVDIYDRVKPVLELLQDRGIIESADLLKSITAKWGRAGKFMTVEVVAQKPK